MKNQTITPLLSTLTKYTAASSEYPQKRLVVIKYGKHNANVSKKFMKGIGS